MVFSEVLSYFLALFVGISLGLIGSGGSILSVPIFVYVLHIEPVLATAYSLFVVGCTAFVGGIQKANQHLVDFKKVFLLGVPTVLAVFLTRLFLMPKIPNTINLTTSYSISKSILILVVFGLVMIFASLKMIRPIAATNLADTKAFQYPKIIGIALLIGTLAGFVGAGGGFLIIPALLFLANTPMKTAIGTSLFIVATQSLLGFLGDYNSFALLDWSILLKFTTSSVVGLFIGNKISKRVNANNLKTSFGYFVLFTGICIVVKELVLR